jgi:hypothetical protein
MHRHHRACPGGLLSQHPQLGLIGVHAGHEADVARDADRARPQRIADQGAQPRELTAGQRTRPHPGNGAPQCLLPDHQRHVQREARPPAGAGELAERSPGKPVAGNEQ